MYGSTTTSVAGLRLGPIAGVHVALGCGDDCPVELPQAVGVYELGVEVSSRSELGVLVLSAF